MNILIPELIHPKALQRLQVEHTVNYDPQLFQRREELLAAARTADALIVRHRTQVKDALLDALGKCRAVGRLGVGLDNIDVEGCKARGMAVIPAIGGNARSVAEYVIASAMLLLRYSHFSVSGDIAAGKWTRPPVPEGHEIAGRTLGLIGFGSIGRLTGLLASRMDMRVAAYDPGAAQQPEGYRCEFMELDELLQAVDVVSIHVPLMPSTRRLINAERLARMRPGAVLINTARGGTVDETALAAALCSGRLAAAALDVFEEEPLPAGSVLVGVPNLFLSPHIAGVTADSEYRVSQIITDAILAVLSEAAA